MSGRVLTVLTATWALFITIMLVRVLQYLDDAQTERGCWVVVVAKGEKDACVEWLRKKI